MLLYIAVFLLILGWILQVYVQKEGFSWEEFSREGTFVAADFVSAEIPQCRSACIQESRVSAYNA